VEEDQKAAAYELKMKRIGVMIFLFLIAMFWYFDVSTRWKVSGSWKCIQFDPQAVTNETFGFFGSHATFNFNTRDMGLTLYSRNSFSGKRMTSVMKSAEKYGQTKDLSSIDPPITMYMDLTELTGTRMTYTMSGNTVSRTVSATCQKND
jgi:hypothetical protein